MKSLLTSLLILFCLSSSYAQLGIKANGTAPIASAQLEVQSTTKAFYPPRMTTAQKNAIVSPQAGAVVYDSDLNILTIYNGTTWVATSGAGLTFPYASTQNLSQDLFKIENSTTGNFSGIIGATNSLSSGAGVKGAANNTSPTAQTAGVSGVNSSTNSFGYGVYGFHNGVGSAIYGGSSFGTGGYFYSQFGYGLKTEGKLRIAGSGVGTLGTNKFLKSINTNGDAEWSNLLPYSYTQNYADDILNVVNQNTGSFSAIVGTTNSTENGSGVEGIATEAGAHTRGVTGTNLSPSASGAGVHGYHAGLGDGVRGYSSAGKGINGITDTGIAVAGLSSNGGTVAYFSAINGGNSLIAIGGKVGIGTSTPAAKMDIKGTNYLSHFYYDTNEDTYIRGGKANSKVLINDIAGMGSVGIGTATPNAKLDIQSSNAYGMIVSQNSGLGALTAQSNSVATTMLVTNTGSGPAIKTIGSIGINTDPTFNLDVSGRIRLRGINASETAGLWLDGTTIPQTSFIGTYNTSKMGIYGINSGWGFIMDVYNGSVGINTVTPNSKLQVAGSVSLPYTEINTNYTVTDNDYSIRIVLPLATVSPTITLPSPVGRNGRIYVISADFPRRTGVNFEQVSIVDNNGNSLIANSPLVEATTAGINFNYLLHIQFNNGSTNLAVKRKLSISVQSTGSKWVIIDNDFQY